MDKLNQLFVKSNKPGLQLSDHILTIGFVGIAVFVTVYYDSVIYGSLFLLSVLFVVSFNNRGTPIEGKIEEDVKDLGKTITKVLNGASSSSSGDSSPIRSSVVSASLGISKSAPVTPTKPDFSPKRVPPTPPTIPSKSAAAVDNNSNSTPIKTPEKQQPVSAVSTPPTRTPPPVPPQKPANLTPSSSPITTTPIPNISPMSSPITNNNNKPINNTTPLSPLSMAPPPSVKVVTNQSSKSEQILEKGKMIGKILPQIPGAINDINTKYKETKEKKGGKGISTLRGIIGDVVKNISTNASGASSLSAEEKEKFDLKRKNIAEEILQTEKVYVGKLKAVVDVYLIPLKTAATENPHPPLSIDQVHTIFSEILTIYNYNTHFLQKLEERMKSNTGNSTLILGDIFLSITDFLKSYSVYINNYSKALQTLEKVRKNQNVENLFQIFASNPACDNLDLTSLLIMPVQRIPRYILLLTEMVKNTDPKLPEHANLTKALDKMKHLASDMNDNRREAELMNKMYELQSLLEGLKEDFINPSRRLIYDTEFIEKMSKSSPSSKSKRYLLCNDIMLRTKPKGKKLVVLDTFDVDSIVFKDIPGEPLSFVLNVQGDIVSLKSVDESVEEKLRDLILNQQRVNKENKSSFEIKRDSLKL
ncbi:hypothetical protein CYY_003187 [Polysphondylium violaceum]|uniref:DH domain-containing protein n=1 Tax=Polysphondylium violaceum TaxID=133409 RepID=A0A8J4V0D0_9MYCE|nr:hypothetical protein CYY_003187 [Polysphondylium violaceum]